MRVAVLLGALALSGLGRAFGYDVVLNAQGEFVDAYLVDGSGPVPRRVVFDDPDPADPSSLRGKAPRGGRHLNGKVCFFPKGFGHDGEFVVADDTYREACVDRSAAQARCGVTRRRSRWFLGKDPDGWAVMRRNGAWTKLHIHTPWDVVRPAPQGNIDPQGCAFDADGRLFATDVGHGDFGNADGSLLVFFPGPKRRYDTYCFLDRALGTPGMPAVNDAGELIVPEPAQFRVTKFGPPFPTSAADCANAEHLVATPPTKTPFPASGLATPAGIARVPGTDHYYIGSVVPGTINEYDGAGLFVRTILPAGVPLNPLGIDVGSDGTVYFVELNLDPMTFSTRCGRVSMVRFVDGAPQAPVVIGRNLRFPDGITVVDSRRLKVDLARLPTAPDGDPVACGGE